jgi:hypothetical protein
MDYKDFFFVYNKQLFEFLHKEKKINFITIAKNPTTNKIFSMFYKTEFLQNAIDEYRQLQK